MLKCVLIDDDRSNLSSLSQKLANHCPEVEAIARCENAFDGISTIETIRPDIVFLDIEMPVMDGFTMLEQLRYRNFALIFVTAYDHYAIRAIRNSALDYLVKPVEIEVLKAAIARAVKSRSGQTAQEQIEILLENVAKKYPQRISIPTNEGLQFIRVDDIVFLEANDNYTHFHLTGSIKFLVSRTLKNFEDLLPADLFIRIHHGTIVNKLFVEKYIRGEGGQAVLINGVVLDVSKRKKAEFLRAISSNCPKDSF